MFTFLLWCILFIICWPLALLALIAYPFVWLFLLPSPHCRHRSKGSSGSRIPGNHAPFPPAGRAVSDLVFGRILE
jgi:hypothetical protein